VLAARWYGREDVRLEDIPTPTPRQDEALIAVEWCGLCGTDLEEYLDGPVSASAAPLILGHEVVGRVVQAAADGSGPEAGALVIPDVVRGCGTCFWCRHHEEGQCPALEVLGLQVDGGLADYMVSRAATCIRVPEHVDAEVAVLSEPLAVAVRAVRKTGSTLGKSIVVIGCGTVGLLVVGVARAAGAGAVLASDPELARRRKATQFGASTTSTPGGLAEAIATSMGATGPDAVIECSGAPGAARLAIQLARPGGECVLVGFHGGTEEMDLVDLVLAEKRVIGSAAHLWDDDMAVAVDLLARGAVTTDGLVTDRIELTKVVSCGFERLKSRDPAVFKIAVSPRYIARSEYTSSIAPKGSSLP